MLCRCYRYIVLNTLVGVACYFACFLRQRAEGAATVPCCAAFVVVAGHTTVKTREESQRMRMASSTINNKNDGTTSRERHVETTRRECIERSFLQAAKVIGIVSTTTSPWNKISVANAATTVSTRTTTATEQQTVVSKLWLCDPAVSSWRKQGRTVHIVGTAHISSISADLAGNVVGEVQVRMCVCVCVQM